MTGSGPTPEQTTSPDEATPAMRRAARMSAANMLRSLGPLVLICLGIVAFTNLREQPDERVQTVDPTSTVQLAAARAGYPVQVPTGLAAGYLVTSARTDAGNARPGGHVTLQIGYLTPLKQYAGFVESDDPGARPVHDVLDGATPNGSVDVVGATWERLTTTRGETVLSRSVGGVTLLVSGSAAEKELATVAGALRVYSG